jgi:hypothetical protein
MAGLALTNEFLLSTATVMLGAPTDLKNLNPTAHSLGLVKNFKMTSDPKNIELTEGVLNDIVATTRVDLGLKASWEMFEYTAKNLNYAAGLDASSVVAMPATDPLASALINAVTVVITGTDKSAVYTAGSWVTIQKGNDDFVHVAKVASVAFSTDTTVTITGYGLPWALSSGEGKIGKVNKLDVGLDNSDHTFAMKVVGLLPNGNKPLVLMFPKVKITKGLDIAFQTNDYGNLPMEVQPYRPVAADSFYDSDFATAVSVLRQ